LFAQFGLRIHEVFSLRHTQVKEAISKEKLIVKGKGGLIRYIPCKNNEFLKAINNYNKQ